MDELARLIPDPDSSEGEERFILMGISSQAKLITVCHCERGLNTIRIISTRRANKQERKQTGSSYFCESSFWAPLPKFATKS